MVQAEEVAILPKSPTRALRNEPRSAREVTEYTTALNRSVMHRPILAMVSLWLAAFGALMVVPTAKAYLGDFEPASGYVPFMGPLIPSLNLGTDWQDGTGNVPAALGYLGIPPTTYGRAPVDVTRYNAGQAGARADILDDSGLWSAAPGSGGRPQFDASNGVNQFQFISTHDAGTRPPGDQNALVVRTFASTNLLDYRYTMDALDLGGIAPGSLTGATYSIQFVFCPQSGPAGNISLLGFADDALNTALQIGTTGTGGFQYRPGSSAALTTTATQIGFNGWSEVTITINTAANTAGITVSPWNDTTSSLGAPISIVSGMAIPDLARISKLNFIQQPGIEKYFYDGFAMSATGGVSCAITGLSVNPGPCNNNGTPLNTADDYYTTDVTVTYANPPASGSLTLTGPALHSSNSVSSVPVGSLGSSTSHTFVGVRLKANGTALNLTARFQ